jgi:FkbM family methyltransferase
LPRRRFYSQHGEDFLLWSLFSDRSNGFYVDVGAFDGKHLSNSYSFELAGWSGLCVEPHPEYYSHLKRNRPRAIAIRAALGGPDAQPTTDFYSEPLGLLSGVHAKDAAWVRPRYTMRQMDFPGFQRVTVPSSTLACLLDTYATPKTIDFLSLDTEGTELAILKGVDLDAYHFRCIVVEANTEPDACALENHLSTHGYFMARRLHENLFFVRTAADAATLAHGSIQCRIEDAVHPLGEKATPRHMRGRRITSPSPQMGSQRSRAPLRLAHIVKLVDDSPSARARHLHIAQPVTFETMRRARERSRASEAISLWAVRHADETSVIPDSFEAAPPLTNYARDFLPALASADPESRLARIADVLSSLQQASEADVFIYTNVDIGLRDGFYDAVHDYLNAGIDAFCINRIDIPKAVDGDPLQVGDIDKILAMPGKPHPGIDCFVFHRSLLPLLNLGDVFLGAMPVGLVMMSQLRRHARRFRWIKHRPLTFHLGEDAAWRRPQLSPIVAANMLAAEGLYTNYFRWPLYRRVLARCLEWCGRAGGERPSP